MKRTQIYLDDRQDRALATRARQAGTTKSALIRAAVDEYLVPSRGEEQALARLRTAVSQAAGAAHDLDAGTEYVETLRATERNRARSHEARR